MSRSVILEPSTALPDLSLKIGQKLLVVIIVSYKIISFYIEAWLYCNTPTLEINQ